MDLSLAPTPAIGDSVANILEEMGLEIVVLLGRAPVMKANKNSSADFINRGGKIPAPIHSFKD